MIIISKLDRNLGHSNSIHIQWEPIESWNEKHVKEWINRNSDNCSFFLLAVCVNMHLSKCIL